MKNALNNKFVRLAGAAAIALSGAACTSPRIPLTEAPLSQDIPPDHVPAKTYATGIGTCSLPTMVIYTDFNTKAEEKYIMGGANIPCGSYGPEVIEVGFCFDKNIPRGSSRGFTYDRYGNISGQRQEYLRPQPGYCPNGQFGRYTITR